MQQIILYGKTRDFLWNLDKNEVPIWSTTLSELKVTTQNGSIPDLVQKGVVDREGNGLIPGDDDFLCKTHCKVYFTMCFVVCWKVREYYICSPN